MKPTDVIIPFNPEFSSPSTLQLVIVNSEYGSEVITLDSLKFVGVPVKEDEWVEVRTDRRETRKLDPSYNNAVNKVFNYICYTVTPKKKSAPVDLTCEYFVGSSETISSKQTKKLNKQKVAKEEE